MIVTLIILNSVNTLLMIYILLVLNNAFKFTNNRIDFFMSQIKSVVKKSEDVIMAFKKMTKAVTDEATQ